MHSSYVNGIMDADTWSGWHGLFTHHLTAPGIRQYWALRSGFFSEQFQSYVASLPRDHVSFTVANLKAPPSPDPSVVHTGVIAPSSPGLVKTG